MMESSESKKKIFYTIILILTLITMIIGATLTYVLFKDSQKEEGTVLSTGKLEIDYIDGIYVENPELYPINNPTYTTTENVYRNNFIVRSRGTLEQAISLSLVSIQNGFSEDAIKYILFNEFGQELSRGNVPKEGSITLASNMYLEPVGEAKYTLLIWLNNNNYNQNFEMGMRIRAQISILSEQIRK